MQITDLATEQKLLPLLRQAFRPMFLFGAAFSAIAMLLWGLALSGHIQLKPFANVLFWHSHEMLFGFVCAIIIGFLLTAVQNWTGLRAPHGKSLLLISLLWLSGRLVLLFGQGLPLYLVAAIDLSFLPVCAWLLAKPLLQTGQQRNLFFVPVLLLLTACNALMYIGVATNRYELIQLGSQNAVWLITLLMAIVGGRVLPMFTANGTQTRKVDAWLWLDRAALGSLWLIFVLHFFALSKYLPPLAMSALFAVSAALTALRCLRWKIWITLKVPLLWSLHLAYWCIPIGLALYSARYAGFNISNSIALHALTAGAMGAMILSMMARVSLGHSGRVLQPKAIMSLAFLLVLAAAVSRTLLIWLWPAQTMQWLWLGVGGWVLAYLLYVVVYFPVLTTPRPDGRPG
ncbi:heme transporter CcmB [Arsukibacterium ikkense]|uniref:Heme transporter CcmB n=1 Tax=Arsukibacterium ikkense TaxID=336831 RepID=A0A0M2VCC6_9GAMM|nr:NnrS family protein [Arsukibacterium ikkense]KKO46778.1 heme transporter CcmB [Arsukibacterium ikkense]